MENYQKQIYVFDHIPKCAGTSMHHLLSRHIPEYIYLRNVGELLGIAKEIISGNEEKYYLGGHFVYGLHELLTNDCKVFYFTLLRNPNEVAYSLYKYAQKTGMAVYGSFIDYLYDNPFDKMTEFLGGSYETAVARLEKYSFVGFVEHTEASILHISNLLQKNLSPLPRYNITKDTDIILSEIDTKFLSNRSDDLRLYEYFYDAYNNQEAGGYFSHSDGKNTQNVDKPKVQHGPLSKVTYSWRDKEVASWYNCDSNSAHLLQLLEEEADSTRIFYFANILAKTNATISDDAFRKILETQFERLIECLHVSQVNSELRYHLVYNIFNKLLFHAKYEKCTSMFRSAKNVLIFLANSAYAKERMIGPDILRKKIFFYRYDPEFWRALAIQHRLNGDIDTALSALYCIQQNGRWTAFCNEVVVTQSLKPLECKDIKERLKDDIFKSHSDALSFLSDNFSFSKRVRVSSFYGRKVLVVRSGPMLLLPNILSCLENLNCTISVVLQKSICSDETRSKYTSYVIDDGWFDPSSDFREKEKLSESEFDAIIFLCSDFMALNRLHNFVEFFLGISGALYAYMFSNLFAEDGIKSLVPLEAY